MKKLLLIGLSALSLTSAFAEQPVGPNCNDFSSNPDGSWSPSKPFIFATPSSQTQIMPSEKMQPQMPGARGWLARYLNARCRFGRPNEGAGRIPRVP
jgi:hypothetical protein